MKKTEREKDLGVTFTPDLSWKDNILETTARANSILGSIKIAFVKKILVFGRTYISLVRSHLEYVVQVWLPTKKMSIG